MRKVLLSTAMALSLLAPAMGWAAEASEIDQALNPQPTRSRWDLLTDIGSQLVDGLGSVIGDGALLIGDTIRWGQDDTGSSWREIRDLREAARLRREQAIRMAAETWNRMTPEERQRMRELAAANGGRYDYGDYDTTQEQGERPFGTDPNSLFAGSFSGTGERSDGTLSYSGNRIGGYLVGSYSVESREIDDDIVARGTFAGVRTRGGAVSGRYQEGNESGGFSGSATDDLGHALTGGAACDTNCDN